MATTRQEDSLSVAQLRTTKSSLLSSLATCDSEASYKYAEVPGYLVGKIETCGKRLSRSSRETQVP